MTKNVLIINGHQVQTTSPGKLNATLVEHAKTTLENAGLNVKTSHVDTNYDVEEEVTKFEWADVIIWQIPAFWFNMPWGTKKYIDDVFMHGYGRIFESDGRTSENPEINYGTGGLLKGTKYMVSMTWNAPKTAFTMENEFFNQHSVDDVMMGTHKAFQFCGMEKLPSFECHDVMKNPQIDSDLQRLSSHLLENIA
tara:strand:- start:3276 stop:3860 length:585 start_codon:yes stop_codon:yes gene_type:complete